MPSPAFVTRTEIFTDCPGRYVARSVVTETTKRAAGFSWLDKECGTNTRMATGRVKVAATATTSRIQYGPIRRMAEANYVRDHEIDDLIGRPRPLQRLTMSSTMSPSFSPSDPRRQGFERT